MILPAARKSFHPDDGHSYWNERAWFSFDLPERKLRGWIYVRHNPNMRDAQGFVGRWNPSPEFHHDGESESFGVQDGE